jgi:hypothetical protein
MEASMRKLLTSLAASAALAVCVSSAMACDFHNMNTTASAPAQTVVAMSTSDTQAPPPAAATVCPPGATCAPASK